MGNSSYINRSSYTFAMQCHIQYYNMCFNFISKILSTRWGNCFNFGAVRLCLLSHPGILHFVEMLVEGYYWRAVYGIEYKTDKSWSREDAKQNLINTLKSDMEHTCDSTWKYIDIHTISIYIHIYYIRSILLIQSKSQQTAIYLQNRGWSRALIHTYVIRYQREMITATNMLENYSYADQKWWQHHVARSFHICGRPVDKIHNLSLRCCLSVLKTMYCIFSVMRYYIFSGFYSLKRGRFTKLGIPIINLRRSGDHFRLITGIL